MIVKLRLVLGRHRCTQCDYTVDRQHILDYHVKNVHTAGAAASPSADDQMTPAERDDDAFQKDEDERSTDAAPPVKRGRSDPAAADQATAAGYRCVVCGYGGHSVAAAARHRLRHSAWSLPHRCGRCAYRATTCRLLMNHARKHLRSDRQPSPTSHVADDKSSHAHAAGHRYMCPYCPYAVDRRRLLAQHRRRAHARAVRQRCRHAACPFTSRDRDQLSSHGRQHAAGGPGRRRAHACDRCSFAVDSRNALSHHRRLHDRRAH